MIFVLTLKVPSQLWLHWKPTMSEFSDRKAHVCLLVVVTSPPLRYPGQAIRLVRGHLFPILKLTVAWLAGFEYSLAWCRLKSTTGTPFHMSCCHSNHVLGHKTRVTRPKYGKPPNLIEKFKSCSPLNSTFRNWPMVQKTQRINLNGKQVRIWTANKCVPITPTPHVNNIGF